ncbi:MAG TPA: YggS family pyridoxal phosphate-dependent enzyme [Chitinophagaceae bacterium]|nr:YggS family pyridoxal phosphate-dependent enzyme [Chitinophagaceae bacterium]
MGVNASKYKEISNELQSESVVLVAVSKIKPVADIKALYDLGQRDFGENYVQELVEKQPQLPADIRWHFIGHLQSNKVKYIASFVHLIHGVDSFSALKEINKQAAKHSRVIDVLLQVHIAQEETKFGLNENELSALVKEFREAGFTQVRIRGLMGMASFSDDETAVAAEFRQLKSLYDQYAGIETANFSFDTLSMGMSGDYRLAIENGSNMVRIGSLLFGQR